MKTYLLTNTQIITKDSYELLIENDGILRQASVMLQLHGLRLINTYKTGASVNHSMQVTV